MFLWPNYFNTTVKVQLNYIIKLNRTKSGATYMAQNLKGVKRTGSQKHNQSSVLMFYF